MHERITIDPTIQHGKPVIAGTRVPVERILDGISGGMSFVEIADAYGIADEDIRACVRFARDLVEDESFHPLHR